MSKMNLVHLVIQKARDLSGTTRVVSKRLKNCPEEALTGVG